MTLSYRNTFFSLTAAEHLQKPSVRQPVQRGSLNLDQPRGEDWLATVRPLRGPRHKPAHWVKVLAPISPTDQRFQHKKNSATYIDI